MANIEFHLFKKNTEAIATNKGFYYQYLKTMKLWLDNFTKGIDNAIYCEREDDIMQFDKKTNQYTFHQIKCYSTKAGLNDEEIKFSLLNFYMLYLKYNYRGTFHFETNSDFKPQAGKTLKKWYENQQKGNFDVSEFIDEVKDKLIELADKDLTKRLKKATKDTYKQELADNTQKFKEQLDKPHFRNFLESIRWSFAKEQDTDRAIISLQKKIEMTISSELEYDKTVDEKFLFAYILNSIVEKSIEEDENKRLLDNELLQNILSLTDIQEKIAERLQPEIIELMKNDFKIIEKFDDIYNLIKKNHITSKSNKLLRRIKKKSSLFVYTSSYIKALTLLKGDNRCCIISGNPGVGKTTLAYMLLLDFIKSEKELEIVKIQSVNEYMNEWKEERKQIFYFDDFLGQNFRLNELKKNEDSDIIELIEDISDCKNKYIIFTTREYILNQAKYDYEQLSRGELNLNKMIIDINHYNNKIKAKILYNHLRYTSLADKYISALLNNNFFLKIINHKNYNPRIIEHLTSKKLLKEAEISNKEYGNYFLENLDFPEKIWYDIIDNDKILDESRILLYILFIIQNLFAVNGTNKFILNEHVEKYFDKQYEYYTKKYGSSKNEKAFTKALKELENSFIHTKEYDDFIHTDKSLFLINFYDPSINDFLFHYLKKNKNILLDLIDGLELFENFHYALGNLFNFENNEDDSRILLTGKLRYFLIQSVRNRNNLSVEEGFLIDKIITNYKIYIDTDIENKIKESLKKFELEEKEYIFNHVFWYIHNSETIYYYYELSQKYKINKYSNQKLYDIASHQDSKGYSLNDLISFTNICNIQNIIRNKTNEKEYIHTLFDNFLENIEDIDTLYDLFEWFNKYSYQFEIYNSDIEYIDEIHENLQIEIQEKKQLYVKEKK